MIVQENVMKRRDFLRLSVGGAVVALSPRVRAQTPVKEIRIGYQKTGVLVIARQQAILEKHFAAKQIAIKWIEFTSGPPLLEAMSTASVDFGAVGDTPPIFAQAANANIVYVAGSPMGRAFWFPPVPPFAQLPICVAGGSGSPRAPAPIMF
jgi:sulfonate transport system substrate-binding protein